MDALNIVCCMVALGTVATPEVVMAFRFLKRMSIGAHLKENSGENFVTSSSIVSVWRVCQHCQSNVYDET